MKDNWITVEWARLEAVAEMMRGRLEAEGIEAVTRGNRASSTAGVINELNISWANPLGGIEIRVRPEDETRAREILAHDDRVPEERKITSTPVWVQWLGAYVVAQTVFFVVQNVAENAIFSVGAALLSFVGMMWLGRRSGKRQHKE